MSGLVHASWTAVPGLRHGFLGVAECAGVTDWRSILPEQAALALPRQVHGATVLAVQDDRARPEADGLVTDVAGMRVGILTADCVPVLMRAGGARAVAAVHAGWRGAAAGVLERAVVVLRETFGAEPAMLDALIGPSIGPCCYEVGPEVRAAFEQRTGRVTEPAWRHRDGKWVVDLRRVAQLLLAAAGVARTTVVGPCTRCDARYFSYRRDGAGAGRQLSFIGLT